LHGLPGLGGRGAFGTARADDKRFAPDLSYFFWPRRCWVFT
jgi:hypothetical protein